MDNNIPYLVEKLELTPEDIIVLSTDMMLSMEQVNLLRDAFRKQIPYENRILILTSGLKLSILTPAQIEMMAQ